ncbi:hypothetical protein Har1130_15765 [Haloarcula sp. CBA1130]|uniref:hypothetical protein n=1 Tax=unclassified Haloarcula TaxID=2624677 RepID=UPI0012441408|nr:MULTISPECIES: hypothetical protein [unclassified Haloarcula]KAA9395844.1 hypothetical protein Har1129_18150 [Haloarcula sp. CBA1129]KAA9400226.1 hypothetical protein Har1130_15765 [Haloarcula sp. CBA1130]
MRCSRRHALRLIGASGVLTASAGCLNPGSLDDYALIASELDLSTVGRPYLWPDPTAIAATTRVDFTPETKQRYLSELYDAGSVTVQQWPLVGRDQWGRDTRPRPSFLRQDGVFYQVQIGAERQLERKRWHFAVTRTDETPPEGATVERPPFDRSAQDSRVLEAALDAVYAGNDGFLGDPQFEQLQTVEYHRHLDAGASELVPSPPFSYVESGDEYFRPVTEQRTVTVPEWTYTIDEITTSREEFEEHARAAILELDLSSRDLSESARGVIDDAISEDPRRYEEGAPPSDELAEVLDAFGIADDLQSIDSYDTRVDFRGVVAKYQGTVYRFSLIVTP